MVHVPVDLHLEDVVLCTSRITVEMRLEAGVYPCVTDLRAREDVPVTQDDNPIMDDRQLAPSQRVWNAYRLLGKPAASGDEDKIGSLEMHLQMLRTTCSPLGLQPGANNSFEAAVSMALAEESYNQRGKTCGDPAACAFKRGARSTDISSNVGDNVNGREIPTKTASEESVESSPSNLLPSYNDEQSTLDRKAYLQHKRWRAAKNSDVIFKEGPPTDA
ncbi:hypothetical protein SCHPADRAFT_892771 [Schizopora paradoxa]|uniref:Uncharacterized protein n=1 Tax=Schizopora paradoxa TaxID=27342 RepID=A0A0H2RDC6_9AGAM|nr:hypothetical protein SCHPADRAFT_892771 [Schizopora paradoxa]